MSGRALVARRQALRDRRGDFGNPSHADRPRVVRGDRLMSVIASKLRTGSDEFRANSSALRALVDELRDKTARTALGGSETARQKHVARGKPTGRGACRERGGQNGKISV